MGTAKRFWDWHAERYAKQPIADEGSYRKKLEITQRYLDSSMDVVEFGCGTGATAILHAPKVASYHAIDVSEKMVEIGRRDAEQAGVSNLSFSAGTLEENDRFRDAGLASRRPISTRLSGPSMAWLATGDVHGKSSSAGWSPARWLPRRDRLLSHGVPHAGPEAGGPR